MQIDSRTQTMKQNILQLFRKQLMNDVSIKQNNYRASLKKKVKNGLKYQKKIDPLFKFNFTHQKVFSGQFVDCGNKYKSLFDLRSLKASKCALNLFLTPFIYYRLINQLLLYNCDNYEILSQGRLGMFSLVARFEFLGFFKQLRHIPSY